jgi:hypothetical protein
MAVTNNPFAPTQQASNGPSAPAYKPPTGTAPIQGLVSGAMPNQPVGYAPATRAFDEQKGTVVGRVDSILAKDGPLMERARSIAREQANSRGLINSSMAIEAGQAAVMDRAMPMAAQDAGAYNQAEQDNLSVINQASQYNATARNQFAGQGNDQRFQALQNTNNNAFQERMQRLQDSGAMARQAASLQSQERMQTAQERGTQNRFDSEAARQNSQFNTSQANAFRQQALTQSNTLAQLGYQNKLATAQVPAQFAASTAASTQDRINQIMGDPDLKPDAKKAAIGNVVAYTNSTLAWAEKFYGVKIAKFSTPASYAAPAVPSGKPPTPTKPLPGTTQPRDQYGNPLPGGPGDNRPGGGG